MKKILLSIVLIFMLLALPVAANPQYKLVVNNVAVDKPVVIINGVSYVPVRAIADIFNAKIDWIETAKIIIIRTNAGAKTATRPPINGDAEFIKKINQALDLLEEKDFPHYVMVCENTTAINQTAKKPKGSSETAIATANINAETGIHPELTTNTEWYTPMFLAGILVHESCHHVDWRYKGETYREDEAYVHELTAFNLLDAPQWMKDHCLNR